MPDLMDAVQDRLLAEAEALQAVREQRPVQGRTRCATDGCGEPISPERTALGAQLCMDCQRGEEARAVHFRTWARR